MGKVVEPSQWLSLIVSFALVLVLLLGTLWVLRRIGAAGLRPQAGRRLAIVESLWLGNRQRVVLLKVDERELLIGISAQGIHRLDGPIPVMSKADGSVGAMEPEASPPVGPGEEVPADARKRFVDAMRSIVRKPPAGDGR
jgi:flagellar protein FliO/FliZ